MQDGKIQKQEISFVTEMPDSASVEEVSLIKMIIHKMVANLKNVVKGRSRKTRELTINQIFSDCKSDSPQSQSPLGSRLVPDCPSFCHTKCIALQVGL